MALHCMGVQKLKACDMATHPQKIDHVFIMFINQAAQDCSFPLAQSSH